MSEKESVTFYQNPKLDYLFGFMGGDPVPTKKDDFKPLKDVQILDDDGNEIFMNLYEKKPETKNVKLFQEWLQNLATDVFGDNIIVQPKPIEVIISFSISEKRFHKVDLDNLVKTIFDGLCGVAFEDDAQVVSLYTSKQIHPKNKNSLFIGITLITDDRKGFGGDIYLFSDQEFPIV